MNVTNVISVFNAIPAGVIKDNAAFVSNVIDKQDQIPHDCKGVLFVCQLGATDKALAVLKVMQSDTETNSTTLGGTPATVHDVVTKPSATDDNGLFGIYIPIHKWTERFLQLQATAGNGTNGTYMSAIAIFDRPGMSAPTAAAMGLTSLEVAA